jgi:hypothetical protein
MTQLEIILIILLWIILGVFICHKAHWFRHPDFWDVRDKDWVCFIVILFSPLSFAWDIFKRVFLQEWHKTK